MLEGKTNVECRYSILGEWKESTEIEMKEYGDEDGILYGRMKIKLNPHF